MEILHFEEAFEKFTDQIIGNSVKFHKGPQVQMRLTVTGDEATYRIVFEDDGPGIPEAYRKKVQRMFTTLDEKTPQTALLTWGLAFPLSGPSRIDLRAT